jgi:hypothetical protein
MRKTWVLISVLGLVLAGRASAAPSFFGPTGLLVIPTADALAQTGWNVHLHAIEDLTTYGANIGLGRGVELGVTGVDPEGGNTEAVFSGKYQFLMETATAPAVAVGVFDIADELDADVGFYVVVSKSLNQLLGGAGQYRLRGHIGYGANSIFDDGLFGGLDLQLTENIVAMAEWLDGEFFIGARAGFGRGLVAELGSYDGEFGGGISFAQALGSR